ncbi:MAG TPA: CDP-alcohol phosphatidyltransferase family protein [Candidatus Acidoferrum sp.]|nr:CDP-alcohol phosphatidyltransferase family protein [Candidatus Acidoferrum sp.]
MLTRAIGRYLSWPIGKLASIIAATGVPPNVITWSGLVLNLWASIFFAAGKFAAAAGLMILAGSCDLLDGPVARKQNRVSKFGGFLESIVDRYADLMLFLGLLVYFVRVDRFSYAIVTGVAMAGAVMVAYAKARAASLVPVEDVGFWDRPERLVLMILGGLVNQMGLALWILAIGPNITVIHRIVHTWSQTEGSLHKVPATGQPSIDSRQATPVQLTTRLTNDPPPEGRVLTRSAGRGG